MQTPRYLLLIGLTFILFTPSFSHANKGNSTPSTRTELTEERINALKHRLQEINQMNLSDLKPREKRMLRKEVKDIRNELDVDERTALSIGAAVLVVVLLILLIT